ncbi:lipopolysaccharide biosynthesis protein [Pseudarthrobacter enclensis]|uniref:lipopolysaccharide biosynthesis protein n=1 Tax=Pseudarthrobacter enclensis TaxID=993070 RepID=UPI0036C0D59C
MTNAPHAGGSGSKGARTTLIGQWLKFAIQLASTVVLARILSPGEFGLFAMIVAFSGLATLLGDFGLSSAAMQAKTLSNQQRSNLFWINSLIGALCSGLILLSAPYIAEFYGQPALFSAIQILAPTFLLQAGVSQLAANAARSLKFSLLARVDVASQLVGFLTALALALSGAGVMALVAQQLAIAISMLAALGIAGQWLPLLPRRAEMMPLLKFGANSLLVQLLTYVTSNVDTVLLGRFWGPAALGLYDRAYQFYRMPIQQIATPLTRVVIPMLSRRQDDLRWVTGKLVDIQKLIAYFVAGTFIILASTAWSMVTLLLGESWLPAAPILAVLSLGGVFQAMGYVYYWAFLITNQTGVQLRASLITRSLMVVLIVFGAFLGPIGVATAVALGLASNWAILSGKPMRATGLDTRLLRRAVLRPISVHLAANLPTLLVGLLFAGTMPAILTLALQVLTAASLYFALACFNPGFRNDLAKIVVIIRKAF